MTSCHLVAHSDLTFLSHINLCHLYDSRCQLVADGERKFLALELRVEQLVFLQVVDDEIVYELVCMLVGSPSCELYDGIVEVLQR